MAVNWPLIDDDTYRVLESFRPFLGPRGNGIVEVIGCLNEMLKSEHGQRMRDCLRSFAFSGDFQSLEVKGQDALGGAKPFSLFIALMLLKLADAPLFEKGLSGRSLGSPGESDGLLL
ncbi:MAG: hypothetical protein ACPLTR_09035 [Thermacetogeniaceae bacterium]